MRIHTVKEGDTVFKIARSYSVPPAKIIENNALTAPDRLYPGQKLIILMPTRSYTVRGGDSLDSIAQRFAIDKNRLKQNNPALMGGDRIYPGQILTIKHEPREYGNAVVNGYFSKDCTKDRLSLYLPYLTYITFAAFKWESRRLLKLFGYESALEITKNEALLPVMRVYSSEPLCELKSEGFADTVASFAKEEGFSAVSLAARCHVDKDFREFLKSFKEKLSKFGLELHLELDGNSDTSAFCDLSEIADVSLLDYQAEGGKEARAFDLCEAMLLRSYAENCRCNKTLLDLFSPIYFGEKATDFSEIEKLIISRGITPDFDEKTKSSSFKLKQYSGGHETEICVRYPSLENTKAKLELLGELGYMGVSFDIMRSPISRLMMFNSLFKPEKMSRSAENKCRSGF